MLEKVTAGDPFPLMKEAVINEVFDAVNKVNSENSSAVDLRRPVPGEMRCRVKNSTETTMPLRGVVQIYQTTNFEEEDPDAFRHYPGFLAKLPDASLPGRRVILLEEIPAGGIGWALMQGIITLPVDVKDSTHRYARAINNDAAKLESAATGEFQLLAYSSVTASVSAPEVGLQDAIVFFPYAVGGSEVKIVQVTAVNSADRIVATKSIILKADLTQTPNYTANANESAVSYPYLVR